MSRVSQVAGAALLALGIALLTTAGSLYGYGAYARWRFERGPAAAQPGTAGPPPTALSGAPAASTPAPAQASGPAPPRPAVRVVAPAIGLDSPVVESALVDGQWAVPKFVAGHLAGTANPGSGGNVALAGHVESLTSGNVFAELGRLAPGDALALYTDTARFDYVVTGRFVVENTDLSVVQPTPREQVTLITCAGTWLPLQRDYDSRMVVVAQRAGDPALTLPAPTSIAG